MPWTLNGCGTTSEFVELLNFGPGPIDISCYILTDGDFAITIPPGTILQPGQFYVLAGQDVIPKPCANIDSTITAHLNWNTCGCTSGPIPTTGDGFMTDGGGASEQLVLLDRFLNVVDAVVRDLPVESSDELKTADLGCGMKLFDLDNMNINYEVLGMSAGRGNSFARKLDGDCGWVKDPQQSANATNNTPSETTDVSYTLNVLSALDCEGSRGVIEIGVQHANLNSIFPMNYTLAFDVNNDGLFTFADVYTYGVDSTPPSILIANLPAGTYRITVGSVKGCYLRTFQFTILPCHPVLPVRLLKFVYSGTQNGQHGLQWQLGDIENLLSVTLEKSTDRIQFVKAQTFEEPRSAGIKTYHALQPVESAYRYYRLKIIALDGSFFYSPVVVTAQPAAQLRLSPNPATTVLKVELEGTARESMPYTIYNNLGTAVLKGELSMVLGHNAHTLPIGHLPTGTYQLQIKPAGQAQPISFRFVKQ